MIKFGHKGDYEKATQYFKKLRGAARLKILTRYAEAGVEALSSATPVESGKTAASWGYEIEQGSKGSKIVFTNSNVNENVNIAIILQYGHGTGTGGWVEGRDYINPAIQPVFDEIVFKIWEEVSKV